jgi:hypothetical protein
MGLVDHLILRMKKLIHFLYHLNRDISLLYIKQKLPIKIMEIKTFLNLAIQVLTYIMKGKKLQNLF